MQVTLLRAPLQADYTVHRPLLQEMGYIVEHGGGDVAGFT